MKIPWFIFGVIASIMAIAYLIVYPGWKNPASLANVPQWKYIIVRWFHGVVWIFLAAASFIQHWMRPQGTPIAKGLAFIALLMYVAFLAVSLKR